MRERDDGTSVVDGHCKVWGVDDLFIGSCAVIETSMACNPTLTTVALAIRICRMILEKLKG